MGTSLLFELLVFLLLPIALIQLTRLLGVLTRSIMSSDGFVSIVFGVPVDRCRLLWIGPGLLVNMPCRIWMFTR